MTSLWMVSIAIKFDVKYWIFLVRNGSPKSNVGVNGNEVHETHIILLHYDIFFRSRCSASENRPRSVLRVKVFFGKGYLNLASF